MLRQLTSSVTPSRDDVILKKAAEMAESFVSCQSIFYPVIMVKNNCLKNIIYTGVGDNYRGKNNELERIKVYVFLV